MRRVSGSIVQILPGGAAQGHPERRIAVSGSDLEDAAGLHRDARSSRAGVPSRAKRSKRRPSGRAAPARAKADGAGGGQLRDIAAFVPWGWAFYHRSADFLRERLEVDTVHPFRGLHDVAKSATLVTGPTPPGTGLSLPPRRAHFRNRRRHAVLRRRPSSPRR